MSGVEKRGDVRRDVSSSIASSTINIKVLHFESLFVNSLLLVAEVPN